jgi:stearoyl-CoA desaturase (Delta-9 desaturase)
MAVVSAVPSVEAAQSASPCWLRDVWAALSVAPLVLVHLALFAIPLVPFSWWAIAAIPFVGFFVGFGVTVGFHRYFAHHSFKTTRWFQFLLAFAGSAALQKGLLWWVVQHRLHHRHSDEPDDPHSPVRDGFWHAHLGWLLSRRVREADHGLVKDLTRFPELVWLDRLWMLPGLVVAAICYVVLGWSGVVYSYCLTVAAAFQITFAVNSIGHLFGSQRFDTGDGSRNNWLIGILALGEGWHNNHHRLPVSARHGFTWYELDVSYLCIRMLELLGLVWNVKRPPITLKPVEDPPHDAGI